MGHSLADNTSLELLSLAIRSHNQTWNGYAKFVSGLGCNTTLRSLRFTASSYPNTPPSREAFEQTIERNHGVDSGIRLVQVGWSYDLGSDEMQLEEGRTKMHFGGSHLPREK